MEETCELIYVYNRSAYRLVGKDKIKVEILEYSQRTNFGGGRQAKCHPWKATYKQGEKGFSHTPYTRRIIPRGDSLPLGCGSILGFKMAKKLREAELEE